MKPAHYTQSDTLQTTEPVDFSPLLGTYANLNGKTQQLLEITLAQEGDQYTLHALGAGKTPVDLGTVPARVYAAGGTSRALGFEAGFQTTTGAINLFANINLNLCVVQTYTVIQDGSGLNHFTKEYFMPRSGDNR